MWNNSINHQMLHSLAIPIVLKELETIYMSRWFSGNPCLCLVLYAILIVLFIACTPPGAQLTQQFMKTATAKVWVYNTKHRQRMCVYAPGRSIVLIVRAALNENLYWASIVCKGSLQGYEVSTSVERFDSWIYNFTWKCLNLKQLSLVSNN